MNLRNVQVYLTLFLFVLFMAWATSSVVGTELNPVGDVNNHWITTP